MAANVDNGYTILQMNPGKDGKEPAPLKKRQEAFKRVVEDIKPSIIFLQEATGPFEKVILDIRPQAYEGIGMKGNGPSMIVDKNEFNSEDLSTTRAGDLTKLVDKLDKEKSAPNPRVSADFDFPLARLRVVKFTSKSVPNLEVLAISWHGPNNNYTDKKKEDTLKDFYVVVKEIRALFRGTADGLLPVIVGGDFNHKFSLWPKDADLIPQEYTPSERRKDKLIDFFVATKDLHASGVKYHEPFELEDGTKAGDLRSVTEMAANVPNGYTILLMNPGKDGKEPAPAKKRQEAFKRVVEDIEPSIIFLQEATGPFEKAISDILPQSYYGIGMKGNGPSMIVDKNEFTYEDLSAEKAGELIALVEKLNKEKSAPNPRVSADFDFPLARLRVVKFISKGIPNLEVLAISWHGPNNNYTDEKKKDALKNFYVVVKEIRALFRDKADELLPVIVGGDFNLKISLWPKDNDLMAVEYTPSKRRENRQIDFFVVTKELDASDVKYHDMSFKLKDGTKADAYLKHDPVQAVLLVRISPGTTAYEVADAYEMIQKKDFPPGYIFTKYLENLRT